MNATTSTAKPQANTKAQGQFEQENAQPSGFTRSETIRRVLQKHGPLKFKTIMLHLGMPEYTRRQADVVHKLLSKICSRGEVLHQGGLYSIHPNYAPGPQANRRPIAPRAAKAAPGKPEPMSRVAMPYRPDFRFTVYTCPELRTAPPRGEASLAPYRLPSRGLSV